MAKKKQKYGVLYIPTIPINLKSQFKSYCAARNRTMTEIIIQLMREKVRK